MKRLSTIWLFTAMACLVAALPTMAEDKLPRLVDLGAKQCIPCKKMAPILEELTKEYEGRLDVEFIDVWQKENAKKGQEYGIKSIPTQIFYSAEGKELWRHEGYISKDGILEKWKELGVDLHPDKKGIERWEPAKKDTRAKDQICYMCDGDIDQDIKVAVRTAKGDVNICSPHHLFVMLSCLQKDIEQTEKSAEAADRSSGKMIPAMSAIYLYGTDETTGRPTIKAFAERKAAEEEIASAGGSIISYGVLKQKELESRCGFCDRAVYPQDASLVKVASGLQTWGCCAHCALGVAARTGKDIEVHQPDGLSGDMIIVKTMNGSVASIEPEGAIAWFGQKKKPDGTFGSAGCFHQGNFVDRKNLKLWLARHALETGSEITIEKALADKMKLSTAQIQNACKIGECSPR